MANIIPVTREVPSNIFITDEIPYLDARAQADAWSKETGLVTFTMPQLADALKSAKARAAIRPRWADVDSAEYYGEVGGDRIYATAHGMGPFSGLDRLKQGWPLMGNYGLIPLNDGELGELMKSVPLYHLDDLKRGEQPQGSHVSFVRIDKDSFNRHPSGQLKEQDWMGDDVALMRTGGMGGRETVLVTLKGEGYKSFGNFHVLDNVDFSDAAGRPLCLNNDDYGLGGSRHRNYLGRFVGGEAPEARSAPQNVPLENRLGAPLIQINHMGQTIMVYAVPMLKQ